MSTTATMSDERVHITDRNLFPIWDKVQESRRLDLQDGVNLFDSDDFVGIGVMANWAAEKISGDKVYYVINRHINPTNICVLSCKFCDFARKPGQEGAYELGMEEISSMVTDDLREVHIVGGHHPTWPFEKYVEMVSMIRRNNPKVQIKAFTASEIDYFERRWKVPPEESLAILKDAGLTTMPGGGAEVFSKRVHKLLLPGKADGARWNRIHKVAHSLGIRSNCTLLYGHVETFRERVEHLEILRETQDETGGFLAFIPLEYQIGTTFLRSRHTDPIDDLKMVSVARLMLDNIKFVKGYWIMVGESTASISLNFGANDMDGTIGEELIAHAAKAASPVGTTRQRMIDYINDAGKVAVERDALYNELTSHPATKE